jgi:hypothetical protein
MRTARTLEAESRKVLRGSVGAGTKEDKSSTGRVRAAGFHHVTARSRLARFETYEPFISLLFKFFSGCGKPQIIENVDTESVDTGARQ